MRGLAKVTCVALLAAIASNLLQHAATLLAESPTPRDGRGHCRMRLEHRARARGSRGSKYEHEHEHESDWSAAASLIDSSSLIAR